MPELTDQPQPAPDFQPNAVEKTLGVIGNVTVAPLLLPILPLVALMTRANAGRKERGARGVIGRALMPVGGLLVLATFLLVCVVAVPYALVLKALLRLGVVRMPPPEPDADDPEPDN